MDPVKTLVVIVGPTAVGKTDLAIRMAIHFGTEIISCDSRQIYRELEIGTAKPTPAELAQVKHHFINSKSVTEEYDAGAYGREARVVIDSILKTHPVAILCGGSGLYVKALLEGFDDLPEVTIGIRDAVMEEYEQKGLVWLQEQVALHDPDYFDVVDRQNPQRLMRALEIIRSTGKEFSGFHSNQKVELPFEVIKIGLDLDREELYQRIDKRMDRMIENGLFEEAGKFSHVRNQNALQTVGYREVYDFMDGLHGREEAIRLMKRNSRRYAKRQMTWFRRDEEIKWFHPEDWDGILKWINEKLVLSNDSLG